MQKVACKYVNGDSLKFLVPDKFYYVNDENIIRNGNNEPYIDVYEDNDMKKYVGRFKASFFGLSFEQKKEERKMYHISSVIEKVAVSKTKYYAKGDGRELNIILSKNEDGCFLDIYIDAKHIYFCKVNNIRLLLMEDLEMVREVFETFSNDKDRWIDYAECHTLTKTKDLYSFYGRETQLDFIEADITFHLKIKEQEGKVFRLEFTNDTNDDVMTCYCHANSIEELQHRMKLYTNITSYVANEMHEHISDILGNTFIVDKDELSSH